MARLSMKCPCGWNFFLPGTTTGHEVNCPNCGQSVPIPGRKPGDDVPQSAGALAARIQRRQSLIKLGLAGAVLIAAGIGVAVFINSSSKPLPLEDDPRGPREGAPPVQAQRPVPRPASPPSSDAPPAPAAPPPLYTAAQIIELRRGVYANVWLSNMAGILSEGMRFRGSTNDWAQLQADMANFDARIKANLTELAKVGEKVVLEPYLQQGDQIIRFSQRDLSTMTPAAAGQVIAVWAGNWTPGVAIEKVDVVRAGTALSLYIQFPETTTELLQMLRHPAIQPDNTPQPADPPNSPDATLLLPLPADFMKNVNDGLAALPPGYRNLLPPDERKRLEDLTAMKKGTTEDIDWIKARFLAGYIPAYQREADLIRSKVLELGGKLKEGSATDVIYRKNGTKVEGQIIDENAEAVRVKSRFGSVPIPRAEIEKIERGKGTAVEFPPKYAEAKDSVDKLVPLLAWCTEKNLKLEKEYVGYTILSMDAAHEKARIAANLPKPVIGAPVPKTPK